jgi:5-methylcytosine-specific restriction endonuclease McrA
MRGEIQVRRTSIDLWVRGSLERFGSIFDLEVDHIIVEKHGGETRLENLCCACLTCNRFKGSDIAIINLETNGLLPL